MPVVGSLAKSVTGIKEECCVVRDLGRAGKSETNRARGQKLGLNIL